MVNDKLFDMIEENLDLIMKVSYKNSKSEFRPFFAASSVYENEGMDIDVLDGALLEYSESIQPEYMHRMELRLGTKHEGSSVFGIHELPVDLNENFIKQLLIMTSNKMFWAAADELQNMERNTFGRDNAVDAYRAFSDDKVNIHNDEPQRISFDMKETIELLKEASVQLKKRGVVGTGYNFESGYFDRYIMTSEGTRIYTSERGFSLQLSVVGLDDENRLIPLTKTYWGKKKSDLPSLKRLIEDGEREIEELFEIIQAPIQPNGTYPTLTDQLCSGVDLHEYSHGFEAHRLQPDEEGNKITLFDEKLGEQVMPEFLTLIDDPTTEEHGSYTYDDEGVKAKSVTLVESGVLKDYLNSRTSAGYLSKKYGKEIRSNGHGRASPGLPPIPRMSNLKLVSEKTAPLDILKGFVAELAGEMGLPYGIYAKGSTGGLAIPEGCVYNDFPKHLFRIYPDGREERIRGVYFVSTPYQSMKNIIITGDHPKAFEGSCGAESGFIPVTSTSPHLVYTLREVNPFPKNSYEIIRKQLIPWPKF